MGSEDDMDECDEDPYEEEYEQGIGDLPSQPVMKRELIHAIQDELREY